ncbi:DUF2924 domain-containing protein [Haliangium ochraceum]|uniref:DUF2924 domain-containing protein n=1 Tax=Haliangium ochraceum TaxID=80816 RepID=UPI001E649A16|nr:DUF2924 domain-containing protein [Haliangium ochraceum]
MRPDSRRSDSRTLRHVLLLPHGFEHGGTLYSSLSCVARAITGTAWNGFRFFRLGAKGATPV